MYTCVCMYVCMYVHVIISINETRIKFQFIFISDLLMNTLFVSSNIFNTFKQYIDQSCFWRHQRTTDTDPMLMLLETSTHDRYRSHAYVLETSTHDRYRSYAYAFGDINARQIQIPCLCFWRHQRTTDTDPMLMLLETSTHDRHGWDTTYIYLWRHRRIPDTIISSTSHICSKTVEFSQV